MSFPTTPILDNFDRANTGPPPSASWSATPLWDANSQGASAGLIVSSNQATSGLGFGLEADSYWLVATGADCEAYATVSIAGSGNQRLFARGANPGTSTFDGYGIRLIGTLMYVNRYDNGVETALGAAASFTISAGNKIGIECIGTTISSYTNTGSWALLQSRTDSTYSAGGYIALSIDRPATSYDDFGGGTILRRFTNTLGIRRPVVYT